MATLFVIPGRAEGANPKSILRSSDYGFRVRSLRSRPGMTHRSSVRRKLAFARLSNVSTAETLVSRMSAVSALLRPSL
jgi:hypothetical protein